MHSLVFRPLGLNSAQFDNGETEAWQDRFAGGAEDILLLKFSLSKLCVDLIVILRRWRWLNHV
jgi:hypothetical protein